VFSLFMFIMIGNLLGLIPGTFTFTSHIIVTFGLALTVFVFVTLLGLIKHGFHFFTLFMPQGVPMALAPILIPIEILSYLSRPVSLSIRLFANMMAGHTMLKVFGGFSVLLGGALGGLGYTVGILPLAPQFSLLGKIGFASIDVDTPAGGDTKTELTYGIGAQYDVTPKIGVRAQWQRYETDQEIDLLSIGVVVRF